MRKHQAPKRKMIPDPIYNSTLIAKAINTIMLDGKKNLAQSILYGALEKVEKKLSTPALEVFNKAINNIMPSLELKTRRVGGANYQVPVEVDPVRRETLALRWLVKYSRLRSEKTMLDRVAGEILDAVNGLGASVKKKDDTHKMAEANKAFAHFRF